MKIKNQKKSAGAVSTVILFLGILLVVVVIIIFVAIRIAANRNAKPSSSPGPSGVVESPEPVYETTIGNTRFVFESAQDLGSVLVSRNRAFQQNLTTTDRFVKVVVGAQNKGKVNIPRDSWDVGNIIDSDGRNFVTINDQAFYFLPNPNLCGALLKPEFEPTPCTKYYEVSKESKDLKIEVIVSDPNSSKKQKAIIDMQLQ